MRTISAPPFCPSHSTKRWHAITSGTTEFAKSYVKLEGALLNERFITDPAGLGKLFGALLNDNRIGAMGCSERAAWRSIPVVAESREEMGMEAAFERLQQSNPDLFPESFSILEFERTCLWGASAHRAFDDALVVMMCTASLRAITGRYTSCALFCLVLNRALFLARDTAS